MKALNWFEKTFAAAAMAEEGERETAIKMMQEGETPKIETVDRDTTCGDGLAKPAKA